MMTEKNPIEQTPTQRKRALDILAKSLYRELLAQGYERTQIVGLATALLGEVTSGDRLPTPS